MSSVLILGAAGFIGSNLTELFHKSGYSVIAIDGCLENTAGDKKHLAAYIDDITFIEKRIEEIDDLDKIVRSVDIIIDSMAWTSHLLAIENPMYDLELNAKSHLHLIMRIPESCRVKIIYLASSSQYGNPDVGMIDESTPMVPEDIQGIHKLAGESYYRVYSKLKNLDVISIRFPNCYGKNQPIKGPDVGLIGGFIKDAINGKSINIFGNGRRRNVIYVNDLVDDIFRLSELKLRGFNAINVTGGAVSILDLAKDIVSIIGKGVVVEEGMNDMIKAIDTGNTRISDIQINKLLGQRIRTDYTTSLNATINYYRENMNALEM